MAYIGRTTDGFGVRQRFLFTPDAGATSVSGTDANGATLTFSDSVYMDVFLNGVLLKAGTDYNTNTANTIAGLTATVANDEVTVLVYDIFTTADMVSATSGGTFSGNVAMSGTLGVTGATTTAAITASGVIKTDDTTDSTSTTTGSIQTDGGLGVAKDLVVGDDILLKSDSAAIQFGADSEVTLTHVADTSLTINPNLTVTRSDNGDNLTLISTDADAGGGPALSFYRNSSSPADGDSMMTLRIEGNNDASQVVVYNRLRADIVDASDGTEDSSFHIFNMMAGTERTMFSIKPDEVVFNEESRDVDFRVESDAKANCFKVDAGNSNVLVTGAGNTAGNSALYIHDQRASSDTVTDLSTSATHAGFRYQGHETDSTVFSIGYSADVAGAYTIQNSNGSTGYYLDIQPYASGISINSGGSATPTAHNGIQVESGIIYCCGDSTSANYKVRFYDNSGMVGSILVSGGSTAFNTSSDYRLKENDKAMSGSIEKVKQLNPISFNFKSTPNVKQEGFFAHEIAEVVPQAVIGEKDGMEKDLDGETDIILPQQVDLGKVVPLLTSALKETIAKIETLEAEVKALKET